MAKAVAQAQGPDTRPDAARLGEAMKEIIGRLEAEAQSRVGKRRSLEERWIADLEQYWGRYDAQTLKSLNDGEKSKLYINMTGPKTDAMSARLIDLLFPTDDKNWGIKPTPVPELTESANEAARKVDQLQQQAMAAADAEAQNAQQLQEQADEAKAYSDKLHGEIMEAKKRADLMEQEIDDQLKQSQYQAAMRDVIEDGCKLGTGVCKGPVTGDRVRKGWKKRLVENDDGTVTDVYDLDMASGDHPAMRHVDIWSFFPDMDVAKVQDSEGILVRHLTNKKKLRAMARLPGFSKDVIRNLLREGPRMSAPSYLADLRNITGDNQQVSKDLYHVWEYSGPIDADDLRILATAMGDEDMLSDVGEIDPLEEVNAIIWFCQGDLLKMAIYPFDSGECMYSIFNLKKDDSSIFGWGIPAIMRDPQSSLNAGWRAMMDNAGLASGPQIAISQTYLEPADGNWTMRPRKEWIIKDGLPANTQAFATFDVPMHQTELANIIALSAQFIDDMTGMPRMAQGEIGSLPKDTPFGTTVLAMNGANVVYRRIVKNFDDDVTVPNIRRMYDWNMQFNRKDAIKGDYEVDARGSSVLLVREMQAQNLMFVATQLGAHPVYGPMLKNRDVLRQLFKAQMIPSDEVMLTDDEIDAVMAQAMAQEGAQDAEIAKIEFEREKMDKDIEIANMESDTRIRVATMQRDVQMMKLAETLNVTLDKIDADLAKTREERVSKERLFAAETAVEARKEKAARDAGEKPTGSGGYI